MKKIFLALLVCLLLNATYAQKKKIILDADTANEVDDLFAIARAALDPNLEILALNGTQWQAAHWTTVQSMEDSHRLNQKLLAYLGKYSQIPTLRGGPNRMYDWGDLAQHSAASYEIIKQAKNYSKENRLPILALGALTNVASALFIDPSIADKISLYWLGTSFDFEKNQLKTMDFNCMMDQRALNLMLNSTVPMHILPVSVAKDFNFNYDDTKEAMDMKNKAAWFLMYTWDLHLDGGRKTRTLWDLALIEAFLNPSFATVVKAKTSIDSGNREINFYNAINLDLMKKDFFEVLKKGN